MRCITLSVAKHCAYSIHRCRYMLLPVCIDVLLLVVLVIAFRRVCPLLIHLDLTHLHCQLHRCSNASAQLERAKGEAAAPGQGGTQVMPPCGSETSRVPGGTYSPPGLPEGVFPPKGPSDYFTNEVPGSHMLSNMAYPWQHINLSKTKNSKWDWNVGPFCRPPALSSVREVEGGGRREEGGGRREEGGGRREEGGGRREEGGGRREEGGGRREEGGCNNKALNGHDCLILCI